MFEWHHPHLRDILFPRHQISVDIVKARVTPVDIGVLEGVLVLVTLLLLCAFDILKCRGVGLVLVLGCSEREWALARGEVDEDGNDSAPVPV